MFWKKAKVRDKFSIENLHYLHEVLTKNPVVTPGNQGQIVECMRAIAEIMIWGDQNNPTFFDFFCEKAFLTHFSKYVSQSDAMSSVKVQVIQTLSILVANVSSTEMIFYILSNNHINDLIVHPFDFSNEEILSHYISFLKTLSLRLDPQTIQFFFNEQAQDFPLYSEAIKFFKHPETMVRTAVRTLSLNVYQIEYEPLRNFIIDRSAIPYFSNVVWFLRDQSILLTQLFAEVDYNGRGKVNQVLDMQIDLLYYLQDIIQIGVSAISNLLVDQMLCHYVLPTLLGSLAEQCHNDGDSMTPTLAMYTLTQMILIYRDPYLVNAIIGSLIDPRPVKLLNAVVSDPPQYGVRAGIPIAQILCPYEIRPVDSPDVKSIVRISSHGNDTIESNTMQNPEVQDILNLGSIQLEPNSTASETPEANHFEHVSTDTHDENNTFFSKFTKQRVGLSLTDI